MLNPSISTFLLTLINVGILFFVLRAILFKPVTKFMEARSESIRSSVEQAEKEREDAQALLGQYQERLKKAEDEAAGIVRVAREAAQAEADRTLAEAKDAAERVLANARKQIESDRQAAAALFRAEAAALVISASSRFLRRELNQEDSRCFAGTLLEELGK
jgi:F-type H+-transporting ATPase subunit b